MLRVFQAAVVLMGGLLFLMTTMIGQAREDQPPPYEMMLHQSRQNNTEVSWLLFNPYTGRSRPFKPDMVGVDFLGWSADGALIYTAINGEYYDLYRAATPDGPYMLLADRLFLPDGVWSADRRWILVQQVGLRGDSIVSVRLDGGGSAVIKGGLNVGRQVAITDYAFAPDGQSVAMTVREGRNPVVYVARLDGTSILNVTPPDTRLVVVQAWLPVEEGLIIHADGKLLWVDTATGATRRVTADKGYATEYVAGWTQAPNGLVWLGVVEGKSGVTAFHLVNASDGRTALDEPNVRLTLYSPDAARIVFLADDGTWVLMEVRTRQRRVLELPFGGVNTEQPVWSPDGQYLVTISHESALLPRYVVWTLDATQASKFVPVWATVDSLFDAFWTPGGDRIVVYSNASLETGLIWMKPDGTDRQRLTHVRQLGQHEFSAWGLPIERDWSQRPRLWAMSIGLFACALVGQATRRFSHRPSSAGHP